MPPTVINSDFSFLFILTLISFTNMDHIFYIVTCARSDTRARLGGRRDSLPVYISPKLKDNHSDIRHIPLLQPGGKA